MKHSKLSMRKKSELAFIKDSAKKVWKFECSFDQATKDLQSVLPGRTYMEIQEKLKRAVFLLHNTTIRPAPVSKVAPVFQDGHLKGRAKPLVEVRDDRNKFGFDIGTLDISNSKRRLVLFAHPQNGYDYNSIHAQKFLRVGRLYTVKHIEVHQSSSTVEFEEIPGEEFNTVLFAEWPDQTLLEKQS